jgi:hypothetical protein
MRNQGVTSLDSFAFTIALASVVAFKSMDQKQCRSRLLRRLVELRTRGYSNVESSKPQESNIQMIEVRICR